MFTGIITHTGNLKKRTADTVEIGAPSAVLKQLKIGDSVAVSGVCLTVIKKTKNSFSADIMQETWGKTTLGSLKIGALVNLELPLRAGDLLSGHIVQGHVDGTAKIIGIKNRVITFEYTPNKRITDKGSITVNGIALTVIKKQGRRFTVGIIPHTWEHTSMKVAKIGDLVNIEVDHPTKSDFVDPRSRTSYSGNARIAIVASSFHKDITDALKSNCITTLVEGSVAPKNIRVIDVPGALEIPLVAAKLAKQKKYDAIIALGVIHKGKTYHFEQVSNECIRGCMEVSEDYEIPIIYEVLSVYNMKDAMERASGKKYNRGKDAAETALKMIALLKNL